MVWCGAVRCGVAWCGAVRCGLFQFMKTEPGIARRGGTISGTHVFAVYPYDFARDKPNVCGIRPVPSHNLDDTAPSWMVFRGSTRGGVPVFHGVFNYLYPRRENQSRTRKDATVPSVTITTRRTMIRSAATPDTGHRTPDRQQQQQKSFLSHDAQCAAPAARRAGRSRRSPQKPAHVGRLG